MYIDKYEIYSYGRKWKNGKQNKQSEVLNYCENSYHGTDGKTFLQLISDLDDAWHKHEGKDCKIIVEFKDHKHE
jgi:hypothetical protein